MIEEMERTQSMEFEIETFNGKNNSKILKVKMHDFLMEQGMVKVFLGK
jgi:hypothetical protein